MEKKKTYFTEMVLEVLMNIPYGKVSTYGNIAEMAGNRRAARYVVRILHSCSKKEKLPWHRVINKSGTLSLKPGQGYEEQKALLVKEGVIFDVYDRVDFKQYLWRLDEECIEHRK